MQQALTAGALDLAIGSGPELALDHQGHRPRSASPRWRTRPTAVVLTVLNDGPKTIADLKGKNVSVSNQGRRSPTGSRRSSRAGRAGAPKASSITPLGTTTAQTAALKTKQIDGMIVEVNAGYRLEEEKSGRVLVQFGDLIKTFHIYVLYAHKDFAEKNPDAVRAFLAGWFETIDWMQKNRDKTIDIVRRKTDVSLETLATRDYDELSGMFNTTGRFNPEALKVLSRSFVEMGMLPSEPDVKARSPRSSCRARNESGRRPMTLARANCGGHRSASPSRPHGLGSAMADKLDDIKARGKLLVGNSETSPPFSSRENGKVVGYDVDLAAQVAKRLGVPMEFVSGQQLRAHPGAAAGPHRPRRLRHDARRQSPPSHGLQPRLSRSRRTPSSSARTAASPPSSRWPARSSRWCRGASVDAELKEAVPSDGDRVLRHLCATASTRCATARSRASSPTRCCSGPMRRRAARRRTT